MAKMTRLQRTRRKMPIATSRAKRGTKPIQLSNGQLKLLKVHGYKVLTAERIRTLKAAHEKFLASARFQPNTAVNSASITLPEAERRVEKYLETL